MALFVLIYSEVIGLHFKYYFEMSIVCNFLCFAIPVYMMVSDSKLMKTIYGKLLAIEFAIFFIGILWKIQHWPGASLILLVSGLAMMITYMARFINKKETQLLDWLKISWVFSFVVSHIIFLRFFVLEMYSTIISSCLFFVMFGYFIYLKYKEKTLFAEKIET